MKIKIEVEVSGFGRRTFVLKKPNGKVRTLTDSEYDYLKRKLEVVYQ